MDTVNKIHRIALELSRNEELASMLTMEEAANFLQVPHAHLLRLVEQGDIMAAHAGGKSVIPSGPLLAYKRHNDIERALSLRELTTMAEEDGQYAQALEEGCRLMSDVP